jgi:hypothetical protein
VVASSTIKRLAEQIEALEALCKAKRGFSTVFVTCERGETSDRAWARHVASHPEDADADVVVTTLYDVAIPGDYERARDLAASKRDRLRLVSQGAQIV